MNTDLPLLDPDSMDQPDTRKVVSKSRRRNVTELSAMLAVMAASSPPGFLVTAEAMMGSPYKPPVKPKEEGPLDYDTWLEANYEDLKIAAAEAGADRELGFDFDYWAEAGYERYVADYWRDNPLSETFRKAEAKRQRKSERNLRNRNGG